MGRLLAIDYGQKRVGVAVTDVLRITANGLTTVPVAQIFDFLTDYFSKEPVDKVIVGLPRQMNNLPSESMRYITPFVNGFKKRFPSMAIEMYDERFTSVLAHKAMPQKRRYSRLSIFWPTVWEFKLLRGALFPHDPQYRRQS